MKNFTTTLIILLLLCKASFAQVSAASNNHPRIQLSIQGNILSDRTTIAFSPLATNLLDAAYDSVKQYSPNPMAPQIASVLDAFDLCFNTLSQSPLSAIIPIRVKVGATGKYYISADSILSMPAGTCVFLEDLATGAMSDLNASPVNAFIIDDTTAAPRFLLHISQPASLSVNPACSAQEGGGVILRGLGAWSSVWQNAAGDTVAIHNVSAGADTLSGLAGGLYTVAANGNTSCSTLADTFMINMAVPMEVNAAVGNIICKGSTGFIDAGNVSGGQAPYAWQWSDGTTGPVAQHLASGGYTLYLTGADGCRDTLQYEVQHVSSLAVGFAFNADTLTMANPTAVFTNSTSAQTALSWDFGDGSEFSDIYHPSHAYSHPGTYVVTLVANDDYCSDTVSHMITVLNTTSISQSEIDHGVSVSSDGEGAVVKFNLAAETKGMIRVYAVDGKLIGSHPVLAYDQAEKVALGNAPGMYLVQIEIAGRGLVKKIIR